MNHAQFWGGAAVPYEIEQSLRFNKSDSARLSRTPSSSGNLRTGTISFWIKRGALQTGVNTQMSLLGCTGNGAFLLRWRYQYDYLEFNQGRSGSVGAWETLSYQRDPSAWMHIVLVNDYTNATSTDRSRIYINGVRQSLNITSTLGDSDGSWNSANVHYIGYQANYFDGYMAEFYNVDGTALDPTNFGKYNTNGVWVPVAYSGSYGTNGFYLKFDPSASNGIGHDHSGNGNHWTPSGFTTSGTGTDLDVMDDTPTNNFATNNPVFPGSSTTNEPLQNGNLEKNTYATYGASTIVIPPSGKYYMELKNRYTTSPHQGATIRLISAEDPDNYWGKSGIFYNTTRRISKYTGGETVVSDPPGVTLGANSYLQVAIDRDAGKVWYGVNNSWYDTATTTNGNPSAGTNPSDDTLPSTGNLILMPTVAATPGYSIGFYNNYGQRPFNYTPPTGFEPLSTAQLPDVDILNPSDHFQTVLDSGSNILSSAQSTFSNGLWWIKDRQNSGTNHQLLDSMRGTNAFILDDVAQSTYSAPSGNSVAWCWSAPDAWSNNSGSNGADVYSSGYRNTTAGFSIAQWTGNRPGSRKVAHGLSQTPEFIITRCTTSDRSAVAYHKNTGTYHVEFFDSYWGGSSSGDYQVVNSQYVQHGNSSTANETGTNGMIMYAWHSVPGFSAFGSYYGNGSSNGGPFSFTGFRPAWILIKGLNTSGGVFGYDWRIIDVKRDVDNPAHNALWANQTSAEGLSSSDGVDILSNGFKIRSTDNEVNNSGREYIWAAFAEHPFGGANVSPSPAR